MSDSIHLATVHLDSGDAPYAQAIRAGKHTLAADEGATQGGGDTGAAPYGLLAASLAACSSITLQMYAARKGWAIGKLHVDISMFRDGEAERFERTVKLEASVTAEQRARLAEIVEKTPVTRTLKRGSTITTTFA